MSDSACLSLLPKISAGEFSRSLFVPLPITNGDKGCGARMIVIDISERRLLEEQLHRDQKMKAIGLMAGGVAHDLNNILSGIISYPELLLLDLDPGSSLCQPLEAIRQSGLDAAEVVSDLLTVARGIAANKEITAPNELIRAYLDSTDFQQLRTSYPLVRVTTTLDSSAAQHILFANSCA